MITILSTNVDKSLWVLDTRSASHICNDMQGLLDSRRLAKGEVIIRVENGTRVAAIVVGRYRLATANGHSIELNNCYFIPSLVKNIILYPDWIWMGM